MFRTYLRIQNYFLVNIGFCAFNRFLIFQEVVAQISFFANFALDEKKTTFLPGLVYFESILAILLDEEAFADFFKLKLSVFVAQILLFALFDCK